MFRCSAFALAPAWLVCYSRSAVRMEGASDMTTRRLLLVLLVIAVVLGIARWGELSQLPALLGSEVSPSTASPEPADAPAEVAKPAFRVLFVGNSYTAAHSLPRLVANLAAAAGEKRRLVYKAETPGGCTLEGHLSGGKVIALLQEGTWERVVLQDQSQVPSLDESYRLQHMYPAVRSLDRAIRAAGARTVFFMTWGYKRGDTENRPDDSYGAMQARLAQGYGRIAQELSVELAPVGLAWEQALVSRPGLELWAGDGMHPSLVGSYLAACVMYTVLYGNPPARNPYHAGLEEPEARFLQEVAAATVRSQASAGR